MNAGNGLRVAGTLTALVVAFWLDGALFPPRLSAQEPDPDHPGRIVGKVVDETTDGPIEGLFLQIGSLGRNTLSNSLGEFTFASVPAGTYQIELRHVAFGSHSLEITVLADQTTRVEVRLKPAAIEVEPLVVDLERRPQYLESVGYYERLEQGWGSFFDPSWVESRNVGFTRADQFVEYVKGRSPALGCANTPVYLDGRRILAEPGDRRSNANNLLTELSTHSFGAVEVYSTGHGVPLFALNDTTLTCGAVIVWSNRWQAASEVPQIEVVLCDPEPESRSVTLDGRVRDALTRVPLPGAKVSLVTVKRRNETLADREGRFRFCDIDQGTGPVVLRGRYADQAGPPVSLVLSTRRDSIEIDVPVSQPGQVVGRVLERDGRRPVRGANVTVEGTDWKTRTDERGWFKLPVMPPGDYSIRVEHFAFVVFREAVSVTSRRTTELSVELERR